MPTYIKVQVKNMKKILLFVLVLVCTVGIVAAADIGNLKVSDGFDNLGNGSYSNSADKIEIDVFDKDVDDFFKNSTDVNYTVVPGATPNTFNFTDGVNNETGVVELIELDGKKMTVSFWTDYNGSHVDLKKYDDALNKFNQLNNVTPLEIK